jgi:inosine triphosphate pyrophosphatase
MSRNIINFVTGNKNKVNELQSIINSTNNSTNNDLIIKAYKLDLPELQGEPEYIATEKCRLASLEIDESVLIEDTSLCFNALGGLPGPYIKWFLDKTGLDGLNKLLLGYEDKSAYAQTIFAYTEGKNKPIYLFIGRIDGKIVPERGEMGFGWDAVFEPDCNDNLKQTFGEMEECKKNMISHRYLALQKFKNFIEGLL